MIRNLALGLLIGGGIPVIALANSNAVNLELTEQASIPIQSNVVPVASSSCTKSNLSISCRNTLPAMNLKIRSELWLQGVATSLLPDSSLFSCWQQLAANNGYLNLSENESWQSDTLPVLERQLSETSSDYTYNQALSSPLTSAQQVKFGTNKVNQDSNLLSSNKLANSGCACSWQKQLKQKSIDLISSKSAKLISNYDSSATHTTPQHPQLSRSSLIVAFPQENSSFVPNSTKLINPAPETERIASGFGWRRRPYSNQRQFHQGIDYGAPYGSSVVAAGDGIVTRVVSGCADFGNLFCGGQLGNWIEIDHGNGIIGTYGHLKSNSITIKEGMKVWKNQQLAQVGSSGWSTGAHLDFRLKVNGKHQDPAKYVMAIDER